MNLKELYNNFTEFKPESDRDSNVLIIDGLNTFIRVFASVPSINDKDEHVGALVGFLRSMGSNIKQFSPTRCIVVFDGPGGSYRRRKLFPEYKANRKVKKSMNRFNEFVHIDQEAESMKRQLARLISYFNLLPITFIIIDNIEADDTIAYIAKQYYEGRDNRITIVSSDRDYIQLVNKNINVWSPIKRVLYNEEKIKNEFGLHPNNYLLYRVLIGDGSDNIPGINGIALKTLKKRFPIVDDTDVEIEDLIEYAEEQIRNNSKIKIYKDIVEARAQMLLNNKLMQLDTVDISLKAKTKIIDLMNAPTNRLNTLGLKKHLIDDKISDFNLEKWCNDVWPKLNLYAGK